MITKLRRESGLPINSIFIYRTCRAVYLYNADNGIFCKCDEFLKEFCEKIQEEQDVERVIRQLSGKYGHELIKSHIDLVFSPPYTSKFDSCFMNEDERLMVPNLMLNISHRCNMACRYCFAESGSYGGMSVLMSEDIAKKALDVWIGQLNDKIPKATLIFFGGEPLLNYNVIKFSIDYLNEQLKNHKLQVEYALTTNGTLLNEDNLTYFKINNLIPVISIDGGPATQNKNRPFKTGQDSYLTMLDKVRLLKKYFNTLQARVTVTHDDVGLFYDNVTHLWEIGFSHVSFEPVTLNESQMSLTLEDMAQLSRQITDLDNLMLDYMKQRKVKIMNTVLKICRAIHFRERNHLCSLKKLNTLVVTPEGDLYSCQRMIDQGERYRLGNIRNIISNLPLQAAVSSVTQIHEIEEKCILCYARNICNGCCPAVNKIYNGDFNQSYTNSCILNKFLFKEALRIYTAIYEYNPEIFTILFGE